MTLTLISCILIQYFIDRLKIIHVLLKLKIIRIKSADLPLLPNKILWNKTNYLFIKQYDLFIVLIDFKNQKCYFKKKINNYIFLSNIDTFL
jgi:hypothetical protein